jgi:hypothetical protein
VANYHFFADLTDGTVLMSKRCDYDQGTNKLPRFWDEGGVEALVKQSNDAHGQLLKFAEIQPQTYIFSKMPTSRPPPAESSTE